MDNYVYMIGIDPDYWTTDDDKACKQYKVDCKGYYELGDEAGFILVGTLKNLKKLLEDYFGVAIVDEYLTEYDYFDFEDGDWIIGGWDESKKSARKSMKEGKDSAFYDGIAKEFHFSKDEKNRYKDKTYISAIAVLFDRINNAIKTYGRNSDEEYNALNDCWEVISSAKQNGFNVDYDEDRWNKIAGLPNYH